MGEEDEKFVNVPPTVQEKGGFKVFKLPLIENLPPAWRKIAVGTVGGSLILLGFLLSVLPGPFTIPLLFAGFAVLASEFMWTEKVFKKSLSGIESAGKLIRHPIILALTLVLTVAFVVLSIKYGWFNTVAEYFEQTVNSFVG